jgi:hypothetical protein
MSELTILQTHFQQYLLTEQEDITSQVVSTPQVSAIDRLEIYRQAYYLRIIEVLQQDYAALNYCMGDQAFYDLATDYIDACPSIFKSIRWYGKKLAQFMQADTRYANQAWLIEMAEFEWLLTESFDATDSAILTIEEMAAIAPETWPHLYLQLHPSLRPLTLEWNTIDNWECYQEENESIAPQKNASPESWIIWRKDYEVQFRLLAATETQMINDFMAGKNIGEICEELCQSMSQEEVSLQLAACLKQFIVDGLVVAVRFSSEF